MNVRTQHAEKDIKQLNSFLKDEHAAVETYRQCIEKVDDGLLTAELASLQSSHKQRVALLTSKVRELGGTPESESGAWGSFAKMVEGSAKVFGSKMAISALEEGEDRGKDNYKNKTDDLSASCKAFINSTILPEQQRSHDELSNIKRKVH